MNGEHALASYLLPLYCKRSKSNQLKGPGATCCLDMGLGICQANLGSKFAHTHYSGLLR